MSDEEVMKQEAQSKWTDGGWRRLPLYFIYFLHVELHYVVVAYERLP